jgi:hypothetical protein
MSANEQVRGPRYSQYVLGVLFLVSVFNYVDRLLLAGACYLLESRTLQHDMEGAES